jgi:hypothetical protein
VNLVGAHAFEEITGALNARTCSRQNQRNVRSVAAARALGRRAELARFGATGMVAGAVFSTRREDRAGFVLGGIAARPTYHGYPLVEKPLYRAMTDITTAPVADQITARLTQALAPTHLEVISKRDASRHPGDDGTGESHFRVIVDRPCSPGSRASPASAG